jgi:hypothetical protein
VSPKTIAGVDKTGRVKTIPFSERIHPKIAESARDGEIVISEMRQIVTMPATQFDQAAYDALKPASLYFSPLMAQQEPALRKKEVYKVLYGAPAEPALKRAMDLVGIHASKGARLSLQMHKLVGIE